MARKKNPPIPLEKMQKPAVRTKVFVRSDMIGLGKIHLLQKVDELGSISAAAKAMGIGYRRAWFLIETIQRGFKDPILITTRGGTAGGATLTDLGRELVARFTTFDAAIQSEATPLLEWLETHQAAGDDPS